MHQEPQEPVPAAGRRLSPTACRQEILDALDNVASLPLRRLHQASGLANPEPHSLVKRGDYVRLVLAGNYRLSFGVGDHNETHVLEPGAMLFNGSGSWHHEHGRESFTVFAVTCQERAVQYFLKRRERDGRSPIISYFPGQSPSRVLQEILTALKTALAAGGRMAALLARTFLEQAATDLAVDRPPASSRAQHLWLNISEYLSEHETEPLARDTVAQAFQIHPAHLSRLCKIHTGGSFTGFLNRRRLTRAAALLRETSLKVYEIALACGYPDPIHFNKAFRRQYGCAPGRYRTQSGRGSLSAAGPSPAGARTGPHPGYCRPYPFR